MMRFSRLPHPSYISEISTSVSDASTNERRSSPPIPADKRTCASLARTAAVAPAPFHYPSEWDGVVWFAELAPFRPVPLILVEGIVRALQIAVAALVVATLLSVALGVGADAVVLMDAAR